MFNKLVSINERPRPFEFYTADELWAEEHTAGQMLMYHLNEDVDLSSRNRAFIERSVEWIIEHFDVGPGVRIADFGCGPGLYTSRLARAQASVTGIDFSSNSIEYARKTAAEEKLNIRYVNENYLDFETEDRFDLVIMIMCDFCALSPGQRAIMLKKFRSILNPGGAILLDVYSLGAFAQREESASYELNQLFGFWSPDKYWGFVNTFKYEEEKVMLDKYTVVEEARTRTVYNWLQYFDRQSLTEEFVAAGLKVDTFFSDVAGTPFDPASGEFAIVAKG
ncbi:MAG: methyltransferase domain-containing protein [Bacteroidales bacterium]|nr:methyltransferase domain-containing protein [Candidatus Latescibacterota bacterium]